MGKKNIKPNLNQPVIRTNVAKPALEGLTEENLTSQQQNDASMGGLGLSPLAICGPVVYCCVCCAYDGDDAE